MRKQQQETRERTNKNTGFRRGRRWEYTVGLYVIYAMNPPTSTPSLWICLCAHSDYSHQVWPLAWQVSLITYIADCLCLGSKESSKFTSPSLIRFEISPFFLLPSFTLQPSDNKGGSCWNPSRQVITSLMDGESEGKGANTVKEQREGSEEAQVIEVRKNKKRNWGFFLAHK